MTRHVAPAEAAVTEHASTTAQRVAPSLLRGLRILARDPRQLVPVLNAQLRLRGTHVPLSARLWGRACVSGRGRISFGERVRLVGTTVPVELATSGLGTVTIGAGSYVNYGTSIAALESVSIGAGCHIGQYAIINDNDYHDLHDRSVVPPSAPVVLEDRVWLGARVIVLKGVRIGHDAVIGAGSVVTRDVPPRTLSVGVPARVIKQL